MSQPPPGELDEQPPSCSLPRLKDWHPPKISFPIGAGLAASGVVIMASVAACGGSGIPVNPVKSYGAEVYSTATTGDGPTASSPSPSPSPQDPAVAICQQFSAIYGNMSSILNADAADPSALTVNNTLDGYASKMSHWTYVVNQAVDNGTTTAGVRFANDLGNAGIATVQVAEPLPGGTPDVQSATDDVDQVQSDCAGLTG
jgi:hypothetical protein